MDCGTADELIAMAELDRKVSDELATSGALYEGYDPRMAAVHEQNALRLQAIMAQVGWPTERLVGERAAKAAWLIAQHAISQPEFQRSCLKLLAEAAREHKAPPAMELSLGTLRVRATAEADDGRQLHDYSDGLRADIQKVLQKNAATRGGSYRATLDLWIDPLRTVQRIDLVRSTGDQSRDTAVADALRGLIINRPTPANTPQPVRVVIVVRSVQ